MDEFVNKIVTLLTTTNKRLSAVKNPDGFLLRDDTRKILFEKSGLELLQIKSGIELRVRYELTDKFSDKRICYVVDDTNDLLPDLKSFIFEAPVFTLAKMIPSYDKNEILQSNVNFDMASFIYNKKITRNLSLEETRFIVTEADDIYGWDIKENITALKSIELRWENVETIDKISTIIINAIKKDAYDEIKPAIEQLNDNFQEFLDKRYYFNINSSYIQKPQMVHKILPYIEHKHQRFDKVALIVIDGMSFWQYLILDQLLAQKGIETKKDMTFAWVPSITKLSRQAIFRGEAPTTDYNQSPTQESHLWTNYWTSSKRSPQKQMQDYEVNYTHGKLSINNNSYRQAFVDVTIDEKMHSLDSNKDLLALTKNWAEKISDDIKIIHEQNYHIYITTDHGNILSEPWRSLNNQEKTYLFDKESRGRRHVIYNNTNYLNYFINTNQEIKNQLLIHDSWAVWRNTKSFFNNQSITHGGAHFLEVIIPFITIKKK